MPLSFGVTVLPDPPASRLVELMKLGEDNGFEIGWTYDSHVLWQESFIQLTLAIQATSRMKFGHLVTNPGTREPTVLDGYARWVDAMLAVVTAEYDVPRVELWAAVLSTARSLGALRHWCDSVRIPAGRSLKLARSLRAFVRSRRSGKDPRRFVTMATKETADSFWSKAGADPAGRLAITLDDWLERQQFTSDRDALEALGVALRARLPELDDDASAATAWRSHSRSESRAEK